MATESHCRGASKRVAKRMSLNITSVISQIGELNPWPKLTTINTEPKA